MRGQFLTHLDLLEPDPPTTPPPREDLCAAALAEVPSQAFFDEGASVGSDA